MAFLDSFLVGAIRFYQRTLSLDHGPLRGFRPFGQCKFHPTCSMYAIRAIERFGLKNGAWLAAKRLSRCHPWAAGGVDDVPGSPSDR